MAKPIFILRSALESEWKFGSNNVIDNVKTFDRHQNRKLTINCQSKMSCLNIKTWITEQSLNKILIWSLIWNQHKILSRKILFRMFQRLIWKKLKKTPPLPDQKDNVFVIFTKINQFITLEWLNRFLFWDLHWNQNENSVLTMSLTM